MWKRYLDLPLPVHILCLGTLINRAGAMVLPFLALYLQDELGFPKGFATLALGAYGGGALVASMVGGHMADQIGRRRVMLASLLGSAVLLLVLSRLNTKVPVLAAVFGFALAAEMYRPAAAAMIADLVEPAERGHAFGLMYFAINLGFSIAPIVGGYLASLSFLWLFWCDAGTCAAYALLIAMAIRETLPQRVRPAKWPVGSCTPAQPDDAAVARTPAEDSSAASDNVPLGEAVRRIVADRPFMIFLAAALLGVIVYIQAFTTFPLYFAEVYTAQSMRAGEHTASTSRGDSAPDAASVVEDGIPGVAASDPRTSDEPGSSPVAHARTLYGWLIAINGIMIVLCQLPVTAAVTRFHRGSVMAVGAIVIGIGYGLTGLAVTPLHFALTVVIWTSGELMQAPLMHAVVGDMAPTELRGRYMGALSMSFSLGLLIGAPIGGAVLSRFGGGALWGGALALSVVSTLLYLNIHKQMAVPGATAVSD